MIRKGEIIVSGQSSVEIQLPSDPRKIEVKFINSCDDDAIIFTTCNPQTFDELDFYVIPIGTVPPYTGKPGIFLHIDWNVVDIKTIEWKVIL